MTSEEQEYTTVHVARELHRRLIESKPYELEVREWSSIVLSEGFEALEEQQDD